MTGTITITLEEYEALVEAREDLEDLRAIEEYRANPGETVPAEFVDRMLAGENIIKLWREHRGLSQIDLSSNTGLNRVTLSNIERGVKTPGIDALKKIAAALNVRVDDLLD